MARPPAHEPPLVCPGCGTRFAAPERFCPVCGLPGAIEDRNGELRAPVSERHAVARQIKPQLAEGELVRVATARNQPEAEFIQNLLLEEGAPSLLRRSAGYDVPDFLAAGPRDVMVPAAAVVVAREVLLQAEVLDADRDPGAGRPRPSRLLAGILVALALGALIIWLAWLATH